MEDVRATYMHQQSDLDNLELMVEYGQAAWEEDLVVPRYDLECMRAELASEKLGLDNLTMDRQTKQAQYDKEINLVTTDLFNYIRNNEKTLIQVKVLEKRAKTVYETLKAQGKVTPELERLASSLLTEI